MAVRTLNTQQLAQALRHQRKSLRLTQQEAARQSGLLPKTVSALENNPGSCRLSTLLKLLIALDLNLGLLDKPTAPSKSEVDW
jgi:HTH-type transcriptional regulator / antitoxin HipB